MQCVFNLFSRFITKVRGNVINEATMPELNLGKAALFLSLYTITAS